MDDYLIPSILTIQFVAIAGAYSFAKFSGRVGNIRSLQVQTLLWVGICIFAFFISSYIDPPETGDVPPEVASHNFSTMLQFFILSGFIGLVMGGIQSLSRSTYAKYLPETEDHASFFSFFDVTEKVAIVIGTLSYGVIEDITGSMGNSLFALAGFFIIGLLLLFIIPKKEKDLPGFNANA